MSRAYPAVKTLEANFFSIDGYLNAGCIVKDGKLLLAPTAQQFTERSYLSPDYAQFCKAANAFILLSKGNFYMQEKSGNVFIPQKTCGSTYPILVEYPSNDYYDSFFIGDKTCIHIRNTLYLSEGTYGKSIFGGLSWKNRIFAVFNDADERHDTICWSGTNGHSDWTSGITNSGWVKLRRENGKIQRLVLYDDKVVAVCETGFAVLTADGAPENYKLSYPEDNLPSINAKTTAVACNKLFFFAGNALYAFDGKSVKRVKIDPTYAISNSVCACALGSWYYVCGYNEAFDRNVVLCLNVLDGTAYFSDVNAKSMCVDDGVYAFTEEGASCVFENCKLWAKSARVDFGTNKRKRVKYIDIDSEGDCDVVVRSDEAVKKFTAKKGRIFVSMSGKYFEVEISAKGNVNGVRAVAEAVYGV